MPTKQSLRLVVQGLGHVPSFKNHKRAVINRKTKKLAMITHPRVKEWMEQAAASIESQLTSLYQIAEAETPTGQSLPSWIQSSMPLDDDLVWIGVPCGSWRRVKPGEEGFEIIIERCFDNDGQQELLTDPASASTIRQAPEQSGQSQPPPAQSSSSQSAY